MARTADSGKKLLAFALLFWLCACEKASAPSSLSLQGPQVFGGTAVTEGEPLSRRMVGIQFEASQGNPQTCSGTLLKNSGDRFFVLTAAHCTAASPEKMSVHFDLSVEDSELRPEFARNVRAIFVHPGYEARRREILEKKLWSEANQFDAAILELASPPPALSLAFSSSSVLNLPPEIFVAGYGAEAFDQQTGTREGELKLRFAEVPVAASSAASSVQPEVLVLDQTQGRGICVGDSGGAAYVLENGEPRLLGLASSVRHPGQSSACEGEARFILLRALSGWIEATLTARASVE